MIARIIGVSLLAAALGSGLGFLLFGKAPDGIGISILFGCVGAIVGAIAGSARETVAASRQKPWS